MITERSNNNKNAHKKHLKKKKSIKDNNDRLRTDKKTSKGNEKN